MLDLLQVKGRSGNVIYCESRGAGVTSCKLGRHPPDLKQVKISEARECTEKEMKSEHRHAALRAHEEVIQRKGYEA